MDELTAKACTARSFIGNWRIQEKTYPEEFMGELVYDPIKGIHELTLYGVCIFPDLDLPKFPAITGTVTTGEKVSVFDSLVTNSNTGRRDLLSRKTVFAFTSLCIGDECFTSKEQIRLRSYSFRCSNLETWFGFHPIRHSISPKRNRSLVAINFPPLLTLYEDDFVRIKLVTMINQNMAPGSLNVSYCHKVSIEAKGNRKLPYYGSDNSFSYYENIIHSFFCLVIGKHAFSFGRIGTTKKQRIILPTEKGSTLLKGKRYVVPQRIELLNACKKDESWFDPIPPQRTLVHYNQLKGPMLTCVIKEFFEKYSHFGFVLDDWIAMKNCSAYTNYSLPEMLYNFEGLHRSLYPECDTSAGYKVAISAIHAISPFEDYDRVINNKKHELPFRQRLQDILLVKTDSIFQFLSVSQRQCIIDDLLKTRNNAAHEGRGPVLPFSKVVSYIFLCEGLIAIMIFQHIGLQIEQIRKMLQDSWEWLDLKKMLMENLEEKKS